MAGYLPMKLKRKDLDDVNDDFSDFSLSSPARKIRRLDAELPPIVEEEDRDIHLDFEPSVAPEENFPSSMVQLGGYGPVIEELPVELQNDERAIVLFKPMNTPPLFQSPSNISLSVDSNIISSIKNPILTSSQSYAENSAEEGAARQGTTDRGTAECLAVVPWVSPQNLPTTGAEAYQTDISETIESEATMDIEEDNSAAGPGPEQRLSGRSEGLHQWQQQHCMIPQFPQTTSTPIVWYR